MINKLKEGHWPIFILSSFSSIANLFLPIILTRLLTPEDIGIYKVFFLYLMLLPFLFSQEDLFILYITGLEKKKIEMIILLVPIN